MYEIFAKLLELKGVTPYQVHKATGVAQSSLSDWKHGKCCPKYEKLQKIANYFGVSVDYLLTGEEKENAPQQQGASDDDIKFALFGTRDIDDDLYEQVKAFAQFARDNRKDK